MVGEKTEAWLSDATGLSRGVLREYREKNLSAADWRKGARGMVVWEDSALLNAQGVWPELDAILEKITGGLEEPERLPAGLEVLEATVIRKFRNPRLIEARTAKSAVLVRVHENKNFVPGMEVRVRRPKVATSPWTLEGRCPRWPGRF